MTAKEASQTSGSCLKSFQMALQLKNYNGIFAVKFSIPIEHFHLVLNDKALVPHLVTCKYKLVEFQIDFMFEFYLSVINDRLTSLLCPLKCTSANLDFIAETF